MSRRRTIIVVVLSLVAAAAVVTPILARPALSRWVWSQLSVHLSKLFDAEVSAESFDVRLFPSVRVEGRGLRLTRHDEASGAPLVVIDAFSVSTSFTRLWNGNVRSVTVDGLTLYLPPSARKSLKRAMTAGEAGGRKGKTPRESRPLTVDAITANNARLVIAPNDAKGNPLVFGIELARLKDFSTTEPARFEARVQNPRPRGLITATGKLGPWDAAEPRKTRLEGDYVLKQADMSVFNGIGGTLDSKGTFRGVLDEIAVSGTTEMVDFSVETGGHPMPLTTKFDARVDGTNGNTYLDHVSARLGTSEFEATGEVAAQPGRKGKTIRMSVKTGAAELEDLITLVVSQRPSPMRGRLQFNARFELPPGDAPVIDTLKLAGTFAIERGRFASDSVQDKIDELSRKGQGQPKDMTIDNVLSGFSGDFALAQGMLNLPRLSFTVRGAEVRLAGAYGLRGERLGFEGELRLQAKVSQTMTGFKSILLKVIDPFFSKHGAGAVLPIKVGGTVSAPEFGLNLFNKNKKAVSGPSARPSPDKLSRRRES